MKTSYYQLYFPIGDSTINNKLSEIFNNSLNIFKIGITAPPKTKIQINNNTIEIGMNGILEIRDTKIESLQFILPISALGSIYIDYMTSQEENE